ncbi:UNVERIFIED_ORG: hypothetical protein ABIC54_001607 [Burkholderia sp. 1263]
MDQLLSLLEKNWDVVSTAPLAFVALAAAMFSLAYLAAKWKYTATISHMQAASDTLKERLVLKTEQAEGYLERALKFDEKAKEVVDSSESALQDKTLTLVAQLRDFMEKSKAADYQAMNAERLEMSHAISGDQKSTNWNRSMNSSMQRSNQVHAEYDRRFRVDAILLRDELRSRLPEYSPDQLAAHSYERPTNYFGMGAVADDLEKMAKLLEAD